MNLDGNISSYKGGYTRSPDAIKLSDWETLTSRVEGDPSTVEELDNIIQKTKLLIEETYNRNPENISEYKVVEITKIDAQIDKIINIMKPHLATTSNTDITKNIKNLNNLHSDISKLHHAFKTEEMIRDSYYELENPDELVKKGEEYRKIYEESSVKAEFYSHWSIKFIEKAAALYLLEDDINKAIALRLQLANLEVVSPSSPIAHLERSLRNNSMNIEHPIIGNLDYGVSFNRMDGQKIKGQNIRVRNVKFGDEEKKLVTFKLAYFEAQNMQEFLKKLNNKDVKKMILDEGICTDVNVEEKNFFYYKFEGDHFVINDESKRMEMGSCISVTLEGLGTIEIGSNPEYGSMFNKVNITLEREGSYKDLQKIVSIMGLTNALCRSTPSDLERMKYNYLIHFFYPRLAAELDKSHYYHEIPIDQLLDKLEKINSGIKNRLENYIPQVEVETMSTGETRFKLSGLSTEIEKLGGRGFITGVSGPTISSQAECAACIMKSGFLSSQSRFDHGLLLGGASSQDDHKNNSADSVYARAITQNAIEGHEQISLIPLTGGSYNIQFVLKMQAVNLMPYFHKADSFGCRNPINEKYGDAYFNRPDVYEHFKDNNEEWNCQNEVMFKTSLDPAYIAGVIYQDPRRELSKIISARNVDFFPEECETAEDKMEFIAKNPNRVRDELKTYPGYLDPALLLCERITEKEPTFLAQQTSEEDKIKFIEKRFSLAKTILKQHGEDFPFDDSKPMYKGSVIAEHWVVNPKEKLKEELSKVGIKNMFQNVQLDDFIKEKYVLDADTFKDCHETESSDTSSSLNE